VRERAAVLAVIAAMRAARRRSMRLICATGSLLRLIEGDWKALELDEVPIAGELRSVVTTRDISRHEKSIARLERQGVRVVTVRDEDYPVHLRMVSGHPAVLFVSGTLRAADRRLIAVIGTRHPTRAGIQRARELTRDLVSLGFTVVSGLAHGIDAAAHREALQVGGQTIAVMGSGINRTHPPGHGDLAREIADHGALVSQFWPHTQPTKNTLLRRKAVLSGLTAGVVVVEGSAQSGSSKQIEVALGQAKPLFFVHDLSAAENWAKPYLDGGTGRVINTADEVARATRAVTEAVDRTTIA
jgi:DNA processing protein